LAAGNPGGQRTVFTRKEGAKKQRNVFQTR